MLIDTHCHLNIIVKKTFDTMLNEKDFQDAKKIIQEAYENDVHQIINVGTSFIESLNSIELAKKNSNVYAAIGIHPNDATGNWKKEVDDLKKFIPIKENKIIAIGECGLDYHYPDYNKNLQYDCFKGQIELALEHDLALVIHTRDAKDEVLKVLSQYKNDKLRGTIHCFSEDLNFAKDAIDIGFVLGIGGTITYPKNAVLRDVIKTIGCENIILETDAPFLPPQEIRGKTNTPAQIKPIAKFIAGLLNVDLEMVANKTTANVKKIFKI